jgi:hypothetical protein
MRFRGGGIGHKSTHAATMMFEEENDVPASNVDACAPEEQCEAEADEHGVYDPSPDQVLAHDDDAYDYDNAEPCVDEEEENEGDANEQDDEDDLGPEDGEGIEAEDPTEGVYGRL